MVLGRLRRAIEERKLVKQAEKRIREKELNDIAEKYVKEYGLSKKEALALAKREKKKEEMSRRGRGGNPFLAITRLFAPPEVVARKQSERARELRRKKEEFTRTDPPSWIVDSSGPSLLLDSGGGPHWLLGDYEWEGNRKKGSRKGGRRR